MSRAAAPAATPLLGAHLSISGGLHNAVLEATSLGCTALQIFTKNATQWRERVPGAAEIAQFRAALAASPVRAVVVHAGYLLNLAAGDEGLRNRSIDALTAEVERCHSLGIPAVILHPGSHGGDGDDVGLDRVAGALREVTERTPGAAVRILLENTAGQGHALGHAMAHLARLLAEGGPPERLGVCFDTCHAFAAGYDLRSAEAARATLDELDRAVGLANLHAMHLNDAKKGLGSRVDRHEHIGRGTIGLEGFRYLMRDARLDAIPKILETPKEEGGVPMDPVNLALLRELAGRAT
jgi:deoxyribonuclease-4